MMCSNLQTLVQPAALQINSQKNSQQRDSIIFINIQ